MNVDLIQKWYLKQSQSCEGWFLNYLYYNMHVVIISDCHCDNAVGRQEARVSSLCDVTSSFVRVSSDVEAAGNMIDVLDAFGSEAGVVVSNIAPRSKESWWLKSSFGEFEKRYNGTPFCYFWIGNKLVVSTVDGCTLSMVKKMKLVEEVNVTSIEKTVEVMRSNGLITSEQERYISKSQFRSFDYVPRLVQMLLGDLEPVSETLSIDEIPDIEDCVWWVDNFGNCKTTLTEVDGGIIEGSDNVKWGNLKYYDFLKDVPEGEVAYISGSSGLGGVRFIEVVKQGGNAALELGLKVGDIVG